MADDMVTLTSSRSDMLIPRRRVPWQSRIQDPIDDWTGVTDPGLRRRLQNRLNQRAHRSRQQVEERGTELRNGTPNLRTSGSPGPSSSGKLTANTCRLSAQHHLVCRYMPSDIHESMDEFERKVIENYHNHSPRTDDLLSLSRVNVLRAAYENVLAAGMDVTWLCDHEAISIFSMSAPGRSKNTVPLSLKPTTLQQAIPHHPWVDVFPFPQMRDNLILAGDALEVEDFCHDLIGFWDCGRKNATLLVWGQPSDPRNWEVTEEFARKWGWLLRGCREILVATNWWRLRRGDKPLNWKDIFAK